MTVRDAGSLGEGANETGLIGAASAAAAEHERMRDDAVRRRMPVARRPGKCRRERCASAHQRRGRAEKRPSIAGAIHRSVFESSSLGKVTRAAAMARSAAP